MYRHQNNNVLPNISFSINDCLFLIFDCPIKPLITRYNMPSTYIFLQRLMQYLNIYTNVYLIKITHIDNKILGMWHNLNTNMVLDNTNLFVREFSHLLVFNDYHIWKKVNYNRNLARNPIRFLILTIAISRFSVILQT